MVSWDDQDVHLGADEMHKGSNEFIKGIPWDIISIEEVSAVNKKVSLDLEGVFHNSFKILKNRIRPLLSPLGIRLGYLRDLKSKMSICGMDKLQRRPPEGFG